MRFLERRLYAHYMREVQGWVDTQVGMLPVHLDGVRLQRCASIDFHGDELRLTAQVVKEYVHDDGSRHRHPADDLSFELLTQLANVLARRGVFVTPVMDDWRTVAYRVHTRHPQ